MSLKCGGYQQYSQGTPVTASPGGKGHDICSVPHCPHADAGSHTQRQNKTSCPSRCNTQCSKKSRRNCSPLSEPNSRCSSPDNCPSKMPKEKCSCKKSKPTEIGFMEAPRLPSCPGETPCPKLPCPKVPCPKSPCPKPTCPPAPSQPISCIKPPCSPMPCPNMPCQPAPCHAPPCPGRRVCRCVVSPAKELEIERNRRLDLEDDVDRLRLQISEMMQSKCMAMNMTKQLKRKYEKMKAAHRDMGSSLSELKKENEFLCCCLAKEKDSKCSKDEASVQVCSCKRKRLGAIPEDELKSLHESLMGMSQAARKHEEENRRLLREKLLIQDRLKKHKDVNKRLSDTNAKLAKSVRKKHESFMAIRDKAGKIKKEMSDYKDEVRKSQQEIERLKDEMMKQQSREIVGGKGSPELEEKLRKTKERERRSSETIQVLNQKIRDMQSKESLSKPNKEEYQRLVSENKAMQEQYDELLLKLQECEEGEKKRLSAVQAEMRTFSANLESKEKLLVSEKDEMKNLIAELTQIVEEQKVRIEELQQQMSNQETVIMSQTEALASKEEQVRLAEKETEVVKQKCLELDQQVGVLRSSVDTLENLSGEVLTKDESAKEKLKKLTEQVEELGKSLDTEKGNSANKDKLIEDLKGKLRGLRKEMGATDEELRRLSEDEGGKTSKTVGREDHGRKPPGDLTSIQRRMSASSEDRRSELSGSLKTKFENQLKDWETERKQLVTERDRAISAAKFATDTLIETMDDFQGQIKSQQRLQRIMTDMINCKQFKGKPCSSKSFDRNSVVTFANIQNENRFEDDFVQVHFENEYRRSHQHRTYPSSDEDYFFTATSDKTSSTTSGPFPDTDDSQYGKRPSSSKSTCRCGTHKCTCGKRPSSAPCRCGRHPCCCKKHMR